MISTIGMGCWGVGNDVYGIRTEQQDIDCLERAMDFGINFFDTSPFYGNSEKVLGKCLNKHPTKITHVATKVGMISDNQWDLKPKHMIKSLNQSMSNLKTTCISLLQIHSPPLALITEETIATILDFKRVKMIRHWGISYKTPRQALTHLQAWAYRGAPYPDFIQINFNLLDQRAKQIGLLDWCISKKINIIARTPLCFGYLCSDIKNENLESTDHRLKQPESHKQAWKMSYNRFRGVKQADETDAQFALRFCWSTPGITTTIPGVTNIAQIEENCVLENRQSMTKQELDMLYDTYVEIEHANQ